MLCYLFEGADAYVLYNDVKLSVVSIASRSPSKVVVSEPVQITFTGKHLDNLDVMYVESSAETCSEVTAVSTMAMVSNGVVSLQFTRASEGAKLCVRVPNTNNYALISEPQLRMRSVALTGVNTFYANSSLRYVTFDATPIVFSTSAPVTRRFRAAASSEWFTAGCGRVSHAMDAASMMTSSLEFPVEGVCAGTRGAWAILDLGESKNVRSVSFVQLSNVKSVVVGYLHDPSMYTFKLVEDATLATTATGAFEVPVSFVGRYLKL